MAELLDISGDSAGALRELSQTLALSPDNADARVAMARNCLVRGALAEAERYAREALEQEPEHARALVTIGHVHLRRGDFQAAHDHAIWALQGDPSRRDALMLLASIKARTNPFLGLWWRFSVWLGELGNRRSILVLMGAYLTQRVATIYAARHAMPMTADIISYVWLGICVYTWVGPGLFHNVVRKELGLVKLRDF